MIPWVLRWRMKDGEVDLVDADGQAIVTAPADLNWRKILSYLHTGDRISYEMR